MSDRTVSSSGVSLPTLLFVLFLGLKLGNVIDWSWWWVTSPLWIPIATIAGFFVLVVVIGLIAHAFER